MRTLISCSLVLLALATGCDDQRKIDLNCDAEQLGSDVTGSWRLEGTGKRRGCTDRRYEGDLEISTTVAIVVTAQEIDAALSEDPADALVQRIVRRSQFSLMAESGPSDFHFDGSTDGSCVSFEMVEDLDEGGQLFYELEGTITSDGDIEGNFSGTGPEDCDVEGTFTVDID